MGVSKSKASHTAFICHLDCMSVLAGSQLVEVEGADHWFAGHQQQLLQAVEAFVVDSWQGR
jgi:alpha/beta superfamily hydrolase